MNDRTVIRIEGEDRRSFLQGLVTNDVPKAGGGLVYAALLTPQGKYLADFFLLETGEALLVDAPSVLAADLVRRLNMYRLRAKVTIGVTDLPVTRGTGPAPEGAHPDPRDPALGWRLIGGNGAEDGTDWEALRVAHCVPETGAELIADDTYILEAGFERLHGVDFRKGCYVGQEVTARMKHKTELRKGFLTVTLDGPVEAGTPVTRDGREIGRITTVSGERAIAYLRFDRAGEGMVAGEAAVRIEA